MVFQAPATTENTKAWNPNVTQPQGNTEKLGTQSLMSCMRQFMSDMCARMEAIERREQSRRPVESFLIQDGNMDVGREKRKSDDL